LLGVEWVDEATESDQAGHNGGGMRIFLLRIVALVLTVLPGIATGCGRPAEPRKAEAEPPAVADSAAAWFAFHKFGRYADSTIGLFIAFDDGSGERVLTPADFAARPFPSNDIRLRTRTEGTLRVRTYLLDDDRDTLAIAATELRLAPDTLWNVLVMPGAIFPAEGGPPMRPLPGTYVTTPILGADGRLTKDSLFLVWMPQSLSKRSVF
jgi:hypothetical protein